MLWVRVIKSVYGHGGGMSEIDFQTKNIESGSTWGNIIRIGLDIIKW